MEIVCCVLLDRDDPAFPELVMTCPEFPDNAPFEDILPPALFPPFKFFILMVVVVTVLFPLEA